MIYYGIVDKLKPEHKNGVYGRRKMKKDESLYLQNLLLINKLGGNPLVSLLIFSNPFTIVGSKIYSLYKEKQDARGIITLQHSSENKEETRAIVIPHNTLNDYYDIEKNKDLFYGLFDNFLLKNKAFEKLMKSKGGSDLIIIERNSMPKQLKHYGGKNGTFHNGLYCTHPKDENQLIPLENSNELLKNIILEETLSAYQNLGAKKIIIEDKTNIESKLSAAKMQNKAEFSLSYEKEILREKQFGKGTFDPIKALENKLFIHDFPNIKTTLEGRINGNQTLERFTENVNLNAGLDVDLLSLYTGNANFEYSRKWYFEVEFYDKKEI